MRENIRMQAMKAAKSLGLVGAAAGVYAGNAMAAIPLTDVQTGLTAAVTSGETVGGYVMVGVAALVVVGLVIGIIKKL